MINNIFKKEDDVKMWLYVMCITLCYGIFFTSVEFVDFSYQGFKDIFYNVIQWFLVVFISLGVFYILALNKYVFSVLFPVLTTISGVLAYYRFTMGVALTPMLIETALINDIRTNLQVVSWELIVYILFVLAVSLCLVYVRFKYIRVTSYKLHLILAIVLAFIPFMQERYKNTIMFRMPQSLFYNLNEYCISRQSAAENRFAFDGVDVDCTQDSVVVVLMLGESLRADHLSLNGYRRITNPNLANDSAVISLPNIYTEETLTHLCIPHIMTRADSVNTELAYVEPSFITLFRRAGFYTTWIANQEPTQNYSYFMNEGDTLIYANIIRSPYTYDLWLDGNMLNPCKEILNQGHAKDLIVMHSVGSHWWYNVHYPEEYRHFVPVVTKRVATQCTIEELVNSYDNTILYTDYVISEVINMLREKNAIFLYLSDHGEALGENGQYMHIDKSPYTQNPACLIWYSSKYYDNNKAEIETLKKNREKRYRNDFLFHSILDAADLTCDVKDTTLSVFR